MTTEARRLLDSQISEREFMEAVIALARLAGWLVWHDQATNAPRQCASCGESLKQPRNSAGWPDLVAIRGEDLLVMELKSQRGELTKNQERWLRAFAGVERVEALMVKPEGWDQVVAMLTTPPRAAHGEGRVE